MGSATKSWFSANKKGFNFFQKTGLTWRLVFLGLAGILLLLLSAQLDEPGALPGAPPGALPGAPPAAPPGAPGVPHAGRAASAAGLSYEEELENKLANLLSQIKGAGSVSVNITLENGAMSEYAKNITRENRSTEEKDSAGGIRTTTEAKETQQVLFTKESGADRPVMVREHKPVIRGVVVVAEGADDSAVKANITKALEAGLGVAPYKIVVLAQRKRGD